MSITLNGRKPDIENVYSVLRGEEPKRPTLFEIFLNTSLYERLAGRQFPKTGDIETESLRLKTEAFAAAGYDYVSAYGSAMTFQSGRQTTHKSTISLNDGVIISDEESFNAYKWPEPENFDYSRLEKIEPYLPEGMKVMVMGPGGVLENVIELTGYDNLCIMLYEEPQLVKAIFDNVGKRLLDYYEISAAYHSVGFLMANDDWGFKTQPFLSPAQMREYVFPWHKKIVQAVRAHKKPIILHSCGYLNDVMDDVIDDMQYDGKHSYEDTIIPVETAYEKWNGRIAVIGGIDMDFIIRQSPAAITARSRAMLERATGRGGYMLGSGNSIPGYVPPDHYFAMLEAALN
jgi:uroporphyrinogen decarboxylase